MRKKRLRVLARGAFMLLLLVVFATRPVLNVSEVATLNLFEQGKTADALGADNRLPNLSYYHAATVVGRKTSYVLGQKNGKNGVYAVQAADVQFTALQRKDGRNIGQLPDYLSLDERHNFLWILGTPREDALDQKQYPRLPALLSVYKIGQSRPIQEWKLPILTDEIQFVRVIDSKNLWVNDIVGNFQMYTVGEKKPKKAAMKFGAFFLDSSGIFWNYIDNYPANQKTKMMREYTLNQWTFKSTPTEFCRFSINNDSGYSKTIFWHASQAGAFLSLWTEPSNSTPGYRPNEAVYHIDRVGAHKLFETDEVVSNFPAQTDEIIDRGQVLKGDDAGNVWMEIIHRPKGDLQKMTKYQIVKVQRLPRWRAWWNSLTKQ